MEKHSALNLPSRMPGVRFAALVIGIFAGLYVHAQGSRSQVHWDEGLRYFAANSSFQTKFGGRVMYDLVSVRQSPVLSGAYGNLQSASGFRRVRAFNSGQLGRVKYKVQFEFSKEEIEMEDFYVEIGDLPIVGNIRAGHFKEPFMLEALTSSKYTTFMERALPNLFSESRNTGLMLHDHFPTTRIYWQLGAFYSRERTHIGEFDARKYSVIGRLSGVIASSSNKHNFLHLGIALKQTKLVDPGYQLAARPEAKLLPKYISTGSIENAKGLTFAALESMWMLGSFSVQSEYVQTYVHLAPEGRGDESHYFMQGAYGQVAYLLTGETRNFKDSNKGFGRIRPDHNFGKNGIGAWEIAVRYSYADLSDRSLSGGSMHNFSVGLNWYLNAQSRILINYILSEVDGMGHSGIYQTRFQIEF
jgi:phosphate-selective porin OprO/OprP